MIWLVLLLINILSLNFFNANLCLISFVLVGANLYGYYHCDKEQAANIQKYGRGTVVSIVANAIAGK